MTADRDLAQGAERRFWLQRCAGVLALSATGCDTAPMTASEGAASTGQLGGEIRTAFRYAFPLYEMARTRYGALELAANPARGTANVVAHRRNLSDHRARAVTTPNNDTLYSSCWIDLSAGPVRIEIDAMPAGRYWSVALMDFFTNHVAVLGSRLDGRGPLQVTLVGPGGRDARALSPGERWIAMPGNDAWLLGRCLVDGPQDLAAARAMQDGLRVVSQAQARHVPRVPPRGSKDPQNFLALVNEALARNPPPAADAALMARLAAVGLRPGASDAWSALPEPVRQAWRAEIGPAHEALRASLGDRGRDVQGWHLPDAGIGNFGQDFDLRAATALGGLAALEPVEAVYFSRRLDSSGAELNGRSRYRIQLPAAGLPNDGFWSLSVYEQMPDGRLFFTDNPIGRFALGDRSAGLMRRADGSMDIWLQRQAPTDATARANWLPAPAGPMQLSLRAYLPRPELREGRATMPTVQRLG